MTYPSHRHDILFIRIKLHIRGDGGNISETTGIFSTNPTDISLTKAGNKDFTAKYSLLTGKIKGRFDSLGVVYNGKQQGVAGMITSTAGKIPTPLQFYFHSDHLGSSNLITDATGGLVQHLEYTPSGEVFVDERPTQSSWSTPYKFNGKELDEETGLYYYGARYYDPRTSVWISVDPLAEKYPNVSSYVYCHNNPVNMIDPDGMGDYYTMCGVSLGKDKNVNDNKVYTADGINKDGSFSNAVQLPGTHTQFQKSSNVVRQESNSNDPNEDLWIAHTANNSAKESNKSLYEKLMSSYSSVDDKSALSTSNNTSDAQRARTAVIDVLSGGADPTGGAKLWDGTDFLAWGLKSPNGTPQNKFEEYSNINISKDIYSVYLKSQQDKYGSSVKYGKNRYSIPSQVFNSVNNWKGGSFNYKTGMKGKSLISTGSMGGSIFWKTK